MIHQIRGTVLETKAGGAVVEVAGFGIFVHLTLADTLVAGSQVSLKTHMCLKQDGVDLYGFTKEEDRKFFQLLLTVSGVGPKTALSILARASREALEGAIAGRDISYLTRVVGLSKKAAEKLAIELSEKIEVTGAGTDGTDAEVFDTLVALGYTDREARKAVAGIPMHVEGRDARLKSALSAS